MESAATEQASNPAATFDSATVDGDRDDVEAAAPGGGMGASEELKRRPRTSSNLAPRLLQGAPPQSWHHATVYYVLSRAPEDAAARGSAPAMFAAGMLMVCGQVICSASVLMGTSRLSCVSTEQCGPRQFCRVEERNRCNFCGDYADGLHGFVNGTTTATVCSDDGAAAWVAEFDAIRRENPEEYMDQNADELAPLAPLLEEWCNTCVHALNGHVDRLTQGHGTALSVAAMSSPDIMVFVVVSYIVALTIVAEVRDVQLCRLALSRGADLNMGWRVAFGMLNGARRWVFAPGLISVIGMLVGYRGGDALNLCLNAVAVLFVCEVDNLSFSIGLGERMRSRVEAAGRIELTDAEAALLARSNAVHVLLVMVGMAGALFMFAQEKHYGASVMAPAFLSFLAGGIAEVLIEWGSAPGATAVQAAVGLAKVFGSFVLGLFGMMMLAGSMK
jgi:hypothetical protein